MLKRITVATVALALLVGGVGSVAAAPGPGDELDEVYASRYTAHVYGVPVYGSVAVSEADGPTLFCVSRYTGQLMWNQGWVNAGECPSPYYVPVNVDWSGSVDACYSRYTGKLRIATPSGCSSGEYAVSL